jgi:hypothetical protein
MDTSGKLSLRHNGRLHHIGIGRTHARTPILMLINGLQFASSTPQRARSSAS